MAATRARCSSMPCSVVWSAARVAATRSSPMTPASALMAANAASAFWSAARRMPKANSAASSNREFDQVGPLPAALTVHGVVGRLPP